MKKSVRLHFKIGIPVLCFGSLLILIQPQMILPCILAAAFHECGHLLFARFLHIPLSELRLDLFGARLTLSSELISYGSEFLICLGGPTFSFLLVLLLAVLETGDLPPTIFHLSENIGSASLALGVFNLFPIKGFDGGRMLSAFLCKFFSPNFAERTEKFLTGCFLTLLWAVSVYLMLNSDGGLSLFVFTAGMFFQIFLS